MPSMRALSAGSSSSRGVSQGVRLVQPLEASWYPSGRSMTLPSPSSICEEVASSLVDVGAVVVTGAHDAAHVPAGQTLVGPGDPLLDGAAHLRVEELVELVGVAGELVSLFGSHDHGVVAVIADRALIDGQRVGAVDVATHVLHVERVLAAAVVDDRHDRLAGHVAAEDEDVCLVVLAGVDELPPAGLRAVHVRGEEEPHAHVGLLRPALTCVSMCRLAPFSTGGCSMRPRGCAGRPGGRSKPTAVSRATRASGWQSRAAARSAHRGGRLVR